VGQTMQHEAEVKSAQFSVGRPAVGHCLEGLHSAAVGRGHSDPKCVSVVGRVFAYFGAKLEPRVKAALSYFIFSIVMRVSITVPGKEVIRFLSGPKTVVTNRPSSVSPTRRRAFLWRQEGTLRFQPYAVCLTLL
jgi:hypothetical protein